MIDGESAGGDIDILLQKPSIMLKEIKWKIAVTS